MKKKISSRKSKKSPPSEGKTSEHSLHARVVRCPSCGKDSVYSTENQFRPFCSERCRMNDLGSWASESYKIETSPDSSADDTLSEDDEKIN